MTKLSDNQMRILDHAAALNDGAVLPLPDDLPLTGGALSGTLGAMRRKGLINKSKDGVWRMTKRGRAEACITIPGQKCDAAAPLSTDAATPQPGSKQAMLIELLCRPEGAAIADIQMATGWQRHSVRGAISGVCKKKLGLTVHSEIEGDRGRVYRIGGDV